MALNIALAEKVLKVITEHPETHDQQHYRRVNCKTTMCIAGWAADLAGGIWVLESGEDTTSELVATTADDPEDVYDLELRDGETIKAVGAHARGRRLLGLTEDRADEMFEALPEAEAVAMLRRSIASAKAARRRRASA